MKNMKAYVQPDDSSVVNVERNRASHNETGNAYDRFLDMADEHQRQVLENARSEMSYDPDKEAFDPDKLERLLDRGQLSESAKERHEVRYSTNPEIRTIEEYAALYSDIEAGGTR